MKKILLITTLIVGGIFMSACEQKKIKEVTKTQKKELSGYLNVKS